MPPDCEYSDKNAFIEFLKDTPAPVWYAQKPLTHVHINDANRAEAKRAGLRTNRISIRMPDALYEIEEWKFALRRLLKSLTQTVGGFFGQICRGESGVVSWWWQGVPLELGVACTLAEQAAFSLVTDPSLAENAYRATVNAQGVQLAAADLAICRAGAMTLTELGCSSTQSTSPRCESATT